MVCTLGPASLRPEIIRGLTDLGVSLFRLNVTHTALRSLAGAVRLLRSHSPVPVGFDLEGAQIRGGMMTAGTVVLPAGTLRFTPETMLGTESQLSLRPAGLFADLARGAVLRIGSDGVTVRVGRADEGGATGIVVEGGRIESNAAVTADPSPGLAPLTGKDLRAVELGMEMGVDRYGLSFASSREDVDALRRLAPGARVTAKIESAQGMWHRDGIIEAADAVLMDRNDLARTVPLEHVFFCQKAVARETRRARRPFYVAANLPGSPARWSREPASGRGHLSPVAAVNDIAAALLDGATGIALAAETAVGSDPLGTVEGLRRCITAFERSTMIVRDGEPVGVAAG